MFHVEQMMGLFAFAISLAMAEPKEPPALLCPSPLPLALATNDETAQRETEAGMVDLLLGWDESACLHFEKALAADDKCLLAYCCLILAKRDASTQKSHLKSLASSLDESSATPAESFYLAAFLKLLSGDHFGAARDFCERADLYRADIVSACWGVLLLHSADFGYTPEGQPEALQRQALERARTLYAAYPDNPCACFMRAYMEEASPVVSPEALEAARKAVELLPEHPAPEHLLGHLLYRSGRIGESISHFSRAACFARNSAIPQNEASLEVTARLYESTALWSAWRDHEALETRRALNALPHDRTGSSGWGGVLLRWEANTLPLRVLVLRDALPTAGEIAAASKAATPEPPLEGEDPVLFVRDCLRSVLYARIKAGKGDGNGALRSLKLAEDALKKFEASYERTLKEDPRLITPWMRAQEACRIALHMARAKVYPGTADLWKTAAWESVQPISLLLPPPIPQRSEKTSSGAK